MEKFVALYDLHWGFERRNGHKVSLHDPKALSVALQFIHDFRPEHVVLGGDILDCGAISHHNHGKPGAVEGFRLLQDAADLRAALIAPLEGLHARTYTYLIGNHEDWLTDLSDAIPAIEGIVGVRPLLKLSERWKVVEQGEGHKLGKLLFIHGDQIRGSACAARTAVEAYERNVRLGHFHTYQVYTKTAATDDAGHTGVVVPCLCRKNPRYNEGAPSKWMQGFEYGTVGGAHGAFEDHVCVIVDGGAVINGKHYRG